MSKRLTDREIAKLEPATDPYFEFDSEVTGLAVKVAPSGLRSFTFDWSEPGKPRRRKTIGQFPVWTIGKARIAASKMRLRADAGEKVVRAKSERIADLAVDWRAVVKLTRRPGTAVQYGVALDNYILPSFGRLTPRDLNTNAIEAWHGGIAQTVPIQANRSLGTLSTFCSF